MKCVVQETCWPNGDVCWKAGQVVEVDAATATLLSRFLKPVKRVESVTKVLIKDVKDGPKD